MTQGIKIYKFFRDELARVGKIRRAWFTTFNLDISFFEKYILSALMDEPFQEMKTAYNYEAINARLANGDVLLEGDKMDVKVFYDYRALLSSGKPKQTSVQIFPLDVKQFAVSPSGTKLSEGVFHPKVILIETYSGELWLMVTSANLTFGGWARNRECFFFQKVESTKNARQVGAFFNAIANSIRGLSEDQLISKLNTGRFGPDMEKWNFVSSFDKSVFLDQLNLTEAKMELRVWSPYFSDKLLNVCEYLLDSYFSTIEIIPGQNEEQKIRITESTYEECKDVTNISFKKEQLPSYAQDASVHAKVWLTPKTLAIGSWNMTEPGMNISKGNYNNIEAGIIYNLKPRDYQEILTEYRVTALKNPIHCTEEEMQKEQVGILDDYSLAVDLVADWDKMFISLQAPTYAKLLKQTGELSTVRLPGLGNKSIQSLSGNISFREYSKVLLTDRSFEIENKNGKLLFRGYLRETGLVNRPVNTFDNIDDYLKGWVLELPEEREELHRLSYETDEETGDEISAFTKKILFSEDQNAWFTSFYAFECIISRIDKACKNYAKEKKAELIKIGRVLPGSLMELKNHLNVLIKTYLEDSSNFKKSPIYLWFLIEKANTVFNYFNQCIDIEAESIAPIKNLKFEQLFSGEKLKEIGAENLKQWNHFILKKIRTSK